MWKLSNVGSWHYIMSIFQLFYFESWVTLLHLLRIEDGNETLTHSCFTCSPSGIISNDTQVWLWVIHGSKRSRTALAFPSPAYTPGYFGCDCTNWYLEVDCGSSVTCCRLIIDLVHRACKSCVSCSSIVWMYSKAWGWWETELNMCVLQKQSLFI